MRLFLSLEVPKVTLSQAPFLLSLKENITVATGKVTLQKQNMYLMDSYRHIIQNRQDRFCENLPYISFLRYHISCTAEDQKALTVVEKAHLKSAFDPSIFVDKTKINNVM